MIKQPEFTPLKLFPYLALAALLWASWVMPEGRTLWLNLDEQAFFLLNGWVAADPFAQQFWAIANFRGFDAIAGGSMIAVYGIWAYRTRIGISSFLSLGLWLAIVVVVGVQLSHLLIEWDRISPSLELSPSYRLSELVTWLPTKDSSHSSFPGDHTSVLLMLSAALTYFTGWRYGIICYGFAILFSLPRLVSGAHWLTDDIIGGGVTAFSWVPLMLYTPLGKYVMMVIEKSVLYIMEKGFHHAHNKHHTR
jgi:membrane-associated phospholipid phosphatase